MFIDNKQNLRNSLGDFLLELSHYFKNIILSEDLLHSDDCFSVNNKNISLVTWLESVNGLLIDAERLKRENNNVEKNIVHSLSILDTRIRRSI